MRVRFLFCLLSLAVISGCGGGNKKAEEPVTVDNFLKSFPVLKLPYVFNDSVLIHRSPDSMRLREHNWRPLISDSVYDKYFGGKQGLRLYAIGKAIDRQRGKYVLVKAVSTNDRGGYLFYFDKDNKFGGAMQLVADDDDAHTNSYARLDSRLNIAEVTETKKPGGFTAIRESIYGLSDDGGLALIMTNTNEESLDRKVFNPIDTLPRHFKWSGDYVAGKNNIVSLRDGSGPHEYQFFIHFVNEEEPCKGDLKGIAEVMGEGRLRFTERGGTCGIAFTLSGNHVTIREVGGCGAYRGASCFFEGSYVKKKAPRPKKKK